MIAPILHGKVSTNISSSPHQTNQPCIVNCSKGRESEIQRALALQHALDEKEMEPEMLKIVKGSKDKSASNGGCSYQGCIICEGRRRCHQNPSPSDASKPKANNDFISQDGSEKNEAQMPSELITSCVASWFMIQVCAYSSLVRL
ncbi:Protein ALWAYS EARLY 2 [Raphanus sativus]|uniref:Protein ALWAYS EARLY 2-like n=1 Tax=Raphanus sativus TaxID=3726 RepID=A0A9W3CKL0_RAPSA|nr:protein ALWAYS EARLY 2-like [Raphanus sativus]XP_056851828.1 protein ALWAYS EARLY 2-like [Raphanus sativus]KAJ4873845.1 Protein ALWAYS EARLY 2 [Raphanus sativus]KAJ4890791.1 Protein ALWAYS EARLY 2 [Raphanus sativus]